MEDVAYEHRYLLDVETGEVILLSDWSDDEQTHEMLTKIDEAEPERYLQVPRAESGDSYADMQEFINTISDERLRELLNVAIQGRGAFLRFKDVLGTPSRPATAMVQLSEGAAGCARQRAAGC